MGTVLLPLIGIIIRGIFWGYATNMILENKGYDENWFWWGFIFGLYAFVVALTKEDAQRDTHANESLAKDQEIWICYKCGMENNGFSCKCGMYRGENAIYLKKKEEEKEKAESEERARKILEKVKAEAEEKARKAKAEAEQKELEKFRRIKEYKVLMYEGIISYEEFEKKKNEILNLQVI